MAESKLGEQESALLAWVAANAPVNVAKVVSDWGVSNGLARTTVTTMLERLRGKGYLKREKQGLRNVWSPCEKYEVQLRGAVGRFVERTLGGSLAPFVAYLNDADLSESQKEQLRPLLEGLSKDPQNEKERP